MSELKSTSLSAALNAAKLNASLNSTIRLNDYIIMLEEIDGGHRLTARKGDQVQSMDIMDGKDGDPGKPGISPLITVTDISGGHRVTITDAEGVKEFDVMDGKDGQGGSGECKPAIIDVVELPTENIDEDSFYRLLTGTFVSNGDLFVGSTCICVDSLPEIGEPVTTDMVNITAYYNMQDGEAYVYCDEALSATSGVAVGWYTLEFFVSAMGMQYGGVITDIADDPMDDKLRILLEYILYQHKKDWTPIKNVGWIGEGGNAVKFNHPDNKAQEWYSTAFGLNTVAEGYTQMVTGRWNIPNGDSLFIVGNGDGENNRSNAHTLDRNGVGWFQGGLKVGGTGQDDEAAVDVLTTKDLESVLLGEITFDNTNTTINSVNGYLTYNDELKTKVTDLINTLARRKSLIYGTVEMGGSIMGMTMAVSPGGGGINANIQGSVIGDAISGHTSRYVLYENVFDTNETGYLQGVEYGYPLTFKFYA